MDVTKNSKLQKKIGVPAVAPWVKNPAAEAWVTGEMQVCSLVQLQWVKGSSIAPAATQVTAMAWIQSLAQELLFALGAAIKKLCVCVCVCVCVPIYLLQINDKHFI